MSNTRVVPERRAGKLLERLEGREFDSPEGIQDLETPNGVENLLDHLRLHFEPIEVFRRGRVVDDFVSDFERQPGEEIKEYEPLKDATLTAIPQARSLRGSVLLYRKQSGAYSAQVVEAQDEEDEGEHVLEANEPSVDALGAEYQEVVAMITIAKQGRAEVDRARQFFRKPQSLEDRKAQLDKLEKKFPCARCGQLGHRKDDNDCRTKVKVVNWRKPKSFQFLQILATFLSHDREQCSTTSSLSSAHDAEARALDEGVCVTQKPWRGPRRIAPAS